MRPDRFSRQSECTRGIPFNGLVIRAAGSMYMLCFCHGNGGARWMISSRRRAPRRPLMSACVFPSCPRARIRRDPSLPFAKMESDRSKSVGRFGFEEVFSAPSKLVQWGARSRKKQERQQEVARAMRRGLYVHTRHTIKRKSVFPVFLCDGFFFPFPTNQPRSRSDCGCISKAHSGGDQSVGCVGGCPVFLIVSLPTRAPRLSVSRFSSFLRSSTKPIRFPSRRL